MQTSATAKTFKSYLFFWSGQLFSLLGSSIIQFSLIWWITDTTGSAIYLSIALFSATIPMVIIPLIFGVFIDRWNRKITIAVTDSLQALITFFLIILFLMNIANVWIVIVLIFLRGICQAIHFPTVNAIIPIMIPKKQLSRMNGINYLFTGLIRVIGPIVAAFLSLFLSIEKVLWIDIITFMMAIIPLIIVKFPSVSNHGDELERQSFAKEFKFALSILKTIPGFLILIVFISIINLLNTPFNTLMPLYVKDIHSGGVRDFAMVAAFFQAGIVCGAIIASSKKTWKNKELIILQSVLIGFGGYLIATLAPKSNFLMISLGALIHAAMIPIANTMFLTILQTKVPPEAQGRVFSIVVAIASAVTPIGMIISGVLAGIFGMILFFLISLALQVLCLIITWVFTDIKQIIDKKRKIRADENTNSEKNLSQIS